MRGWPKVAAAVVAVGMMVGAGPVQRVAAQVQNVGAILPLNAWDFSHGNLVLFACALNGHPETCELDTGNAGPSGLYISQPEANYIGAATNGQARVMSAIGWGGAEQAIVSLRIGSRTAQVATLADAAYVGAPLVGIGALRDLGIQALALDLRGDSLVLLGGPAR